MGDFEIQPCGMTAEWFKIERMTPYPGFEFSVFLEIIIL